MNARDFFRKGLTAQHQNNLTEAIKNYTLAIKSNPQHWGAYINRGFSYSEQNKMKEAVSDYSEAIKLSPSCHTAYNNRGFMYYKEDKLNKAIVDFTQAIKHSPTNSLYYYNRGRAYKKLKKINEAIVNFTQAIELDVKNIEYYEQRAILYQQNKQWALAFQDEKKINELTKLPSLKNTCKFFILHHHGRIMAINGVRHMIEKTPVDTHGGSVTDKLRFALEINNITPDTIDLVRQSQGLVTGSPTLFNEIRDEEAFYLRRHLYKR